MSKYHLFGCDIELTDNGRKATVSKDGVVLESFATERPSVLDCLENNEPTPQVQAQRFAKSYKPPKPEAPKGKQKPKTEDSKT